MIDGVCERCGKLAWINTCTFTEAAYIVTQEICAECFDKVGPVYKSSRAGSPVGKAPPADINPSFDNAVKTIEDGR